MSENPALEAHEHLEHAEHAEHEHDPFISYVAITVAALAVLAAGAGSLETMEGEGSLGATSEAVLMQDRATDTWNEFQADSIKKHLYTVASKSTTDAANIAYYKKQAKEYGETQNKLHKDAEDREKERDDLLKESAHHEERHKWLTGSATLFEIGIALSTVAIITRRSYLWYGALLFGAVGVGLLAFTYAVV
ncbi:MAG: DUF4337 domain-containing protein [Alphaproteobacteria bacterium]|nr:DUF4337 domain-containing protein [Alphaproteobacteria bacterium]MBL7099744.1 DUF4337 domain-containing protein [Alphaproteobacteria bacterium]